MHRGAMCLRKGTGQGRGYPQPCIRIVHQPWTLPYHRKFAYEVQFPPWLSSGIGVHQLQFVIVNFLAITFEDLVRHSVWKGEYREEKRMRSILYMGNCLIGSNMASSYVREYQSAVQGHKGKLYVKSIHAYLFESSNEQPIFIRDILPEVVLLLHNMDNQDSSSQ